MYVGHAAAGIFVKSRRPHLSALVLVVVAYGPDWIQALLGAKLGSERWADTLSHSLPSIVIGAAVGFAITLMITGDWTDAGWVALLYASHWPLDFLTALKPTWIGGPLVGLMLYSYPWLDFFAESAVVVACAWAYGRALTDRPWRSALWMSSGLIVVHALSRLVAHQP